MTVFNTGPAAMTAMTADFHAGDIGYVKKALGHYVENTGNTDLVFLEVFRGERFEAVSLSDWLAHSPADMVAETLNLDPSVITLFPKDRPEIVPQDAELDPNERVGLNASALREPTVQALEVFKGVIFAS